MNNNTFICHTEVLREWKIILPKHLELLQRKTYLNKSWFHVLFCFFLRFRNHISVRKGSEILVIFPNFICRCEGECNCLHFTNKETKAPKDLFILRLKMNSPFWELGEVSGTTDAVILAMSWWLLKLLMGIWDIIILSCIPYLCLKFCIIKS